MNIDTEAYLSLLRCKWKKEETNQKFPKGSIVKIKRDMNHLLKPDMKDTPVFGVIEYSYSQAYRGNNYSDYSVLVLDMNGNSYGSISWFCVSELELFSDDTKTGFHVLDCYDSREK
jgi:hypothetical protein